MTPTPMLDLPGLACATPSTSFPNGRTGTGAGYYAHLSAGEKACRKCRAAQLEYQKACRARAAADRRSEGFAPGTACTIPSPKYPNGKTGTQAGRMAHHYYDEETCDACKRASADAAAAYKAADPDRTLSQHLFAKYRLTLERYREILARQNGRCGICGADAPTDIRTERFHVDHDHACCPGRKSCGKCVRGLLCHFCNTALGNFRDSPTVLRAALRYLGEYGK